MSMHVGHAIKATIIQPCCRERNQAAEITVWSGSRCNPELEDTKVPLREVVSFVRATPLLSIVSGGNSTSSPIPASCHSCAPLHLSIGASVPTATGSEQLHLRVLIWGSVTAGLDSRHGPSFPAPRAPPSAPRARRPVLAVVHSELADARFGPGEPVPTSIGAQKMCSRTWKCVGITQIK